MARQMPNDPPDGHVYEFPMRVGATTDRLDQRGGRTYTPKELRQRAEQERWRLSRRSRP